MGSPEGRGALGRHRYAGGGSGGRLRPINFLPARACFYLGIRFPIGCALIIRLIIQTIRQDPSGTVWTDEAPNVSRPDPSGADQTDAEHQATDLAVGGSNPSRRAQRPRSATRGCLLCLPRHHLCPSGWGIKEPPGDQEARQPLVGRRVCRPRAAHRTEAPDEGPRTCRPGWRCTVRAGVRRPAGRGPGPPLPPLLLVVGRFWLPPPVGDPTGSAAGCQPAQSSASGGSGGAARCGRTGLDS
jgi:hypothetical protein